MSSEAAARRSIAAIVPKIMIRFESNAVAVVARASAGAKELQQMQGHGWPS